MLGLRVESFTSVAEAYTTQPNSKASSGVLYNIFESTCGGVTVITHMCENSVYAQCVQRNAT